MHKRHNTRSSSRTKSIRPVSPHTKSQRTIKTHVHRSSKSHTLHSIPSRSTSHHPSPVPGPGETRPFRVLGVQQIALGSLHKSNLMTFWNEAMGIPQVGHFRSERENVDEAILKISSGPVAVEVDIMEPINPDASPKVHVPTLNHIGLWIDNLDQCVEYLTHKGVRFTPGGIRKGASGHNVCFVHPKGNEQHPISTGGSLIELVQAPPDVIEFYAKYPHEPQVNII